MGDYTDREVSLYAALWNNGRPPTALNTPDMQQSLFTTAPHPRAEMVACPARNTHDVTICGSKSLAG
jgi:hypothetical protein